MIFKKILLAALLVAAAAHGAAALELTSPDLAPGAIIDNKFAYNAHGCEGGNVAPALNWSGAPEGTRSFALFVHDPDARKGAGFWHWLAIDIPADARGLAQGGKLPAGAREIKTDFGAPGYNGPCPPKGDMPHHYNFTIYALKVPRLDLPAGATASQTSSMVEANALAHATLTAVYGR